MKFAMNGAITIGTLDGANIEIRDAVGHDNFFLFGLTAEEVERLKAEGYRPRSIYQSNPELGADRRRISLTRARRPLTEDYSCSSPRELSLSAHREFRRQSRIG